MRRVGWVFVLGLAVAAGELVAQAVPEGSQAARVQRAYRRTPHLRIDPFRHAMIPHWGLVFSGGAQVGNNAFTIRDIRAFIFLDDNDKVLVGDILDAIGLVPVGQGVQGFGRGEGGVHLGGPFGRHLSLGFSLQWREYSGFQIDDGAVALLRDGNGARQNFPLGETAGSALLTGELGVHAVIRLGPLGSEDGAEVSLGFGGRSVRSLAYGRFETTMDSRVFVTGDSIAAKVDVRTAHTPEFTTSGGSGILGDFLVRLEWPTSGFALEAMIANVGGTSVQGVERSTRLFNVETLDIQAVIDEFERADSLGFVVQDTVNIDEIDIPRLVRFSASAWANRILQLDASATLPVSGEFENSLIVDLVSTWRFVTTLPLRAGLVLGGRQGLGYTAGLGIEARNFYFQAVGGSLGGLFGDATGASIRTELGFFF